MARKKQGKCLPSGDVALSFVRDPSPMGALKVLGTMVVRGTLVGAGLFVAGVRGKQLLTYTAAGTAGVEAGVLGWALYKS